MVSRPIWSVQVGDEYGIRFLAKACCEMSRRDGAIVAWHEVPGTVPPQKSRPVGYGAIRAGVPGRGVCESNAFLQSVRESVLVEQVTNAV